MSQKVDLKIDWATHEAAKYACENWHYSKCVPTNKLVKIGAWENGRFIGVVIFSPGASANLYKTFNISNTEGCELTRVALTSHQSPVTRIVSLAIKFLKKSNPGLKLIISFADSDQDHIGIIYQAGNWLFTGISGMGNFSALINGKWVHNRTIKEKFGLSVKAFSKKTGCKIKETSSKYRYVMPLDEKTKQSILKMSQPYPKRAVSKDIVVHPDQG